jgi:hypothetical protein
MSNDDEVELVRLDNNEIIWVRRDSMGKLFQVPRDKPVTDILPTTTNVDKPKSKWDDYHIIKRDGRREKMCFDKITERVEKLTDGLDLEFIKPAEIVAKAIIGVVNDMKTSDIDTYMAEETAHMATRHPDFSRLSGRLAVTNLQKTCEKTFSATCRLLYEHEFKGVHCPLIAKQYYEQSQRYAHTLDEYIRPERDLRFDYFAFQTLYLSYFLKLKGNIGTVCFVHCDKYADTDFS